MVVRRFLCSSVLLSALAGSVTVPAQTFRRVREIGDMEDGARYVLASYCRESPDSVYVMSVQDKTGTKVNSRAKRKLPLDENGRIHVDDGGTAVFELEAAGNTYSFRDVTLEAWLAYSSKEEKNSTSASLYTLTDEEIKKESASQINRNFVFSQNAKTPILTKVELKKHCLSMNGANSNFKLRPDGYNDSLFIYKELQSPTLERGKGGDWTFKGDWTADSLFALDYAQARRIDFTEIPLPQGRAVAGGVRLPGEYVWTYVRKGDAERLPEGWLNVVEIERKDSDVQGKAATRMTGCDSCALEPKYSFTVPEDSGITWYRETEADGGWMTVGLPFSVKKVTWEDADGETVAVERLRFEEIAGGGAVFRKTEADEDWEAGTPYLWRPSERRKSVVCFRGDGTVVQGRESGTEEKEGFYAMFGRYDIKDEKVYLLDDSGEHFVQAAEGSWIAPGRGYLVVDAPASRVRLVEDGRPTGVKEARNLKDSRLLPVYGLDGKKKGVLCPGEPVPEEWPRGIYVTPLGKFMKR